MYLRVALFAGALILSYFLGQAHCQKQIVTKQIEVIKYVKNKQKEIWAEPSAAKSELLEFMRRGTL